MSTTSDLRRVARRLPVGAELQPDGGVHFRLWAPAARAASVAWEGASWELPLSPIGGGYFEGFAPDARAGTLYRYRLDSLDELVPDPASRFQPMGPHGPSEVID